MRDLQCFYLWQKCISCALLIVCLYCVSAVSKKKNKQTTKINISLTVLEHWWPEVLCSHGVAWHSLCSYCPLLPALCSCMDNTVALDGLLDCQEWKQCSNTRWEWSSSTHYDSCTVSPGQQTPGSSTEKICCVHVSSHWYLPPPPYELGTMAYTVATAFSQKYTGKM